MREESMRTEGRSAPCAFSGPAREIRNAVETVPASSPGRGAAPLIDMSLAMLLVGATAPLGELALDGIPLFAVLAVRLALAGAALSVWSGAKAGRIRLSVRHWGVLAFQALCGVIVFNVGLWLGMRESGPAAAGVFTSATPVFMAALGIVFFGEKTSARALLGIGLTVAGVIAARGLPAGGWRPAAGDALLLASVAGEAVFLLALKWLPKGLSPLDAARRITWLGLAMVLPLAVWQTMREGLVWPGWTPWLAVAALGVLVTAGGYVLWFKGVVRARSSQAGAVTGIMPVSAVLSSWVLLGSAPGISQLLGCAGVGLGIWLAASRVKDDGQQSRERRDHFAKVTAGQPRDEAAEKAFYQTRLEMIQKDPRLSETGKQKALEELRSKLGRK